jgi:hypothetical protein
MAESSSAGNVRRQASGDEECDAIGDLIGHYGKWQFMMTILLSLFQVPNTFHIFSPTFQVSLIARLSPLSPLTRKASHSAGSRQGLLVQKASSSP